MKKIAIAAVLATILGAGRLAGAAAAPTCCACVEGHTAQTNQVVNGTATNALFCAAAPGGNTTALADRCAVLTNSTGGGALLCTDFWANTTCRVELAQAGVVCPDAGVPAADPLNLAALAVVLGAAGSVLLRRRSRPRA